MASILPLLLALSCSSWAAERQGKAQVDLPPTLVAPDATLIQQSAAYRFTEGPVAGKAGAVFFTDQPNNRIVHWQGSGQLEDWLSDAGRANGLSRLADGRLIACADGPGQLWAIKADKSIAILADGFAGKRFNGPNDCWVHPDGSIYFTDPFYKRKYWQHETETQAERRVYRWHNGMVSIAATGFQNPNGIVGTADGQTLYIADTNARSVARFTLAADGSLTDRKNFCAVASDGMTLDSHGNLYCTGKTLSVWAADGSALGTITLPQKWISNVCFAGPDNKLLFITARNTIWTLQMAVSGAPRK